MENTFFTISEIERETGISRDTLRVWERRYRFPLPERNQRSERLYTCEHLERLRLLKQLLDRGMRPGKLMGLAADQLRNLTRGTNEPVVLPDDVESLMGILTNGPHCALLPRMEELLQQYELRSFLTEVVAPMNVAVGDAWFTGRIGILEEHLYAEQIRRLLTRALDDLPRQEGCIRILLTTFPGEAHGIGVLMAACMLGLEGAEVLLLGVQTPLEEIVRGAIENRSNIVGISCSEHLGRRTCTVHLLRLRNLLPESIALWAGGSGVAAIRFLPGDIRLFTDLRQLPGALF